CPRGMMVTLCSGCVCCNTTFTSAWPASCQAVNFLSSSVIARLRRSRPQRTLSRASSSSSIATAFLFVPAANNAASFKRLVSSAAKAVTAAASNGVNFIDENQAGGVLACLLEHIPHAAGADTDKHLDEV